MVKGLKLFPCPQKSALSRCRPLFRPQKCRQYRGRLGRTSLHQAFLTRREISVRQSRFRRILFPLGLRRTESQEINEIWVSNPFIMSMFCISSDFQASEIDRVVRHCIAE